MTPGEIEALRRAATHCGGIGRLSRKLGITHAHIAYWASGRARGGLPGELCLMVERVTHGIVKRWELRPDLWTSDDPPLDYDESFGSVTPYIKPTADAKKERRRTYIREYMRARRAVAKSIFGTVVD